MTENDKIKDLEVQARNTRHLVDRLNTAYYGMTWIDLIKALGNREGDDGKRGDRAEDTRPT